MKEEQNLTKKEFEERANIYAKYERFRDERGDSCGFYDEYLEFHYQDYLKGLLYTDLLRKLNKKDCV